jgi:NAD(P)H-hydrate epimerase
MREMDRLAIDTIKIPGIVLMENAGAGATEVIEDVFEDELDFGAIILCGPGNNGGDGYVIARHLYTAVTMSPCSSSAPKTRSGRCAHEFKNRRDLDIPIYSLLKERDLEVLEGRSTIADWWSTRYSAPACPSDRGLAARVIDWSTIRMWLSSRRYPSV